MYINEQSFRRWWDVFHDGDDVVEIRFVGAGNRDTWSGIFTDPNEALFAIQSFNGEMGCYSPFNPLRESVSGKKQRGEFIRGATTTSDNDIVGRRWIMIDFDPVRSSGTNSTLAEKAYAKTVMTRVGVFLRDRGFESPVVVDSANGYHLYYRVSITADKKVTVVKDFIGTLSKLFGDDRCEIDLQVANACRITKVVGTKTDKGCDTVDRPQRESKFIQVPDEIKETDIEKVRAVIEMSPRMEQDDASRWNNYRSEFNLEEFLERYGIEVSKRTSYEGGEKLVLAECPFDSSHKAPDAAIFVTGKGAIGFKCLHNSCSSYGWKDVRMHYDPDAYARKDVSEFQRRRDFNSTAPRPAPLPIQEDKERGKKWLDMADIEYVDPDKQTFIPTGVKEVDDAMVGWALGEVSVVTGLTGSGKTNFILDAILTARQHGYKSANFSGEFTPSRFKNWLNRNAAGANNVCRATGKTEYYYCPERIAKRIDEWTRGYIYLYNTNYGYKTSQLLADVRECINRYGTQLIILDNKMVLELDSYTGDSNERDTAFMNELTDIAKKSMVHIILVVHPRKEMGFQFLRLDSIKGSGAIAGSAANVLILHRVGKDFEQRARVYLGSELDNILAQGYNEVVEIAKNRIPNGVQDVYAGLYYEMRTKRYLNSRNEYIAYGWGDVDLSNIPATLVEDDLPEDDAPQESPLPNPVDDIRSEVAKLKSKAIVRDDIFDDDDDLTEKWYEKD